VETRFHVLVLKRYAGCVLNEESAVTTGQSHPLASFVFTVTYGMSSKVQIWRDVVSSMFVFAVGGPRWLRRVCCRMFARWCQRKCETSPSDTTSNLAGATPCTHTQGRGCPQNKNHTGWLSEFPSFCCRYEIRTCSKNSETRIFVQVANNSEFFAQSDFLELQLRLTLTYR